MTRFVGIDPGMSGGIAFMDDDESVGGPHAFDLPDTEDAIYDLLHSCLGQSTFAVIERQSTLQQGGKVANFKFGQSYGFLRGLLSGFATSHSLSWSDISAKVWQSGFGLPPKCQQGERKRKLLSIARMRFPTVKLTLRRGDAMLLADFCRSRLTLPLDPDFNVAATAVSL